MISVTDQALLVPQKISPPSNLIACSTSISSRSHGAFRTLTHTPTRSSLTIVGAGFQIHRTLLHPIFYISYIAPSGYSPREHVR
jgi:hypothetical protein